MTKASWKLPYLPEGKELFVVPATDSFMVEAKLAAQSLSLDNAQQVGSVLVKDGKVIGRGANGSDYHKTHVCERVRLKIPTGQGYELCEGCHPKNHSEPKTIADARKNGFDVTGADLYMYGHYWACESCWKAMITAGVRNVFLVDNAYDLFAKKK